MLSNPLEEIERRKQENIREVNKGLFTKSRILFLISVFFVVSLPLIYRYMNNFL